MLGGGAPRDKTQAELVAAVLSCTTDESEATAKNALEVLSVLALNTQKPIAKARNPLLGGGSGSVCVCVCVLCMCMLCVFVC